MPLVLAARLQGWRDIGAPLLLHRRTCHADLVIHGDWNLTFGSETSLAAGSLHAEPESSCAWYPREMMQRVELFLPAAFAFFFVGAQSWTHVGIKGGRRRIDFVAVPLRWSSFCLDYRD